MRSKRKFNLAHDIISTYCKISRKPELYSRVCRKMKFIDDIIFILKLIKKKNKVMYLKLYRVSYEDLHTCNISTRLPHKITIKTFFSL